MWDKISNSFLFLSDDFYNSNFYKNPIFIKKLYFYYKNKGYKNIILSHLINIIISIFLYSLIIFLFNCIEYHNLFILNDYQQFNKFINWNNFFKLNWFLILLTSTFVIFTTIKILNLFDLIYSYKNIKKYYNENLKIHDDELLYIKWDKIVNKIEKYNNETINIYYINSIILFNENFLISLFDNNIIKINYLTNLMEWNIIYCILLQIFDKNNNTNKKDIKQIIYNKIRVISIINYLFMPFILLFILFYNIFNYGESFYNKPTLLTSRIFTKNALLKFRYYNELSHDFDERLEKSVNFSISYSNIGKNIYFNAISKLIVFICSSIFTIFILLSLINDKILIYVYILNNKSVLWFLSILGTVITIFKYTNNSFKEPKYYMTKISENIYFNEYFIENSNNDKIRTEFLKLYQYKIITILKDIIYTIFTPFKLWLLSNDIDNIVDFIFNNINSNNENLTNCKMANFNDLVLSDILNNEDYEKNKTNLSLVNFIKLYPEWYKYMIKKINGLTNNIQINII